MRATGFWRRVAVISAVAVPPLVLLPSVVFRVQADTGRTAASIISPKRDGLVGASHEVVGKLGVAGQPLVLVRPDVAGGEWYVQPSLEASERGYFKSKARFGNDKSTPGQRFQIAVVVLRTAAEREFFRGKEFVPALPESLAHSAVVSVVLGNPTDSQSQEAAPKVGEAAAPRTVTRPLPNGVVRSITDVAGRVGPRETPLVLVRCDQPNEAWWVQGPVEFNKKGEFVCPARFGNERTPSGQKFRVIVLALAKPAQAEQLAPGKALLQLPDDVPRSEEVVVTLERQDTTGPTEK